MKLSDVAMVAAALSVLTLAAHAQQPDGERGPGALLARADANGDGAVTRTEFDVSRAARFTEQDADRNGALSAAEREGRGGRLAQRFNPDANGDGVVSRAEFDAQGATMFTRLDANNDGRIVSSEMPIVRGPSRRACGLPR